MSLKTEGARRTSLAIVAALTVAGAAARIPGLNSGLWFDEIVTLVESVRPSLFQVLTAFPGNNNHPLYSLLAHASIAAFGEQAWTLRLPALAFGVASIPLLYWLGATITSRAEALLATLLLTVSYHHVWFSQNARAYTMLLAITLLSTVLLVRLLECPRRRLALCYGVAVGLGIYAHLTMAFVVAAHFLVWSWEGWRPRAGTARAEHVATALLALGTAALLAALLYVPMLGQVYRFFSGPSQATAAVATSQWAALELLRGLRVGFGTVGVAAALGLLVAGGLSYLRRDPLLIAIFTLPGALTGAAMVVLHAPIRPRFFFMFIGFGLLILVRGAMDLGRFVQASMAPTTWRRDAVGSAAVLLVAVVSVWSLGFNYRYPKQDFGGARAFIEAHRREGEPVATSGLATYPYERYYGCGWTPIENAEQFDRLRTGTTRAWVVYSFPEYMEPGLVDAIERHCTVQQVFRGTLGGGDLIVCATGEQSA